MNARKSIEQRPEKLARTTIIGERLTRGCQTVDSTSPFRQIDRPEKTGAHKSPRASLSSD
jgi:hypothetical protein